MLPSSRVVVPSMEPVAAVPAFGAPVVVSGGQNVAHAPVHVDSLVGVLNEQVQRAATAVSEVIAERAAFFTITVAAPLAAAPPPVVVVEAVEVVPELEQAAANTIAGNRHPERAKQASRAGFHS